jgi:hypothetical protein
MTIAKHTHRQNKRRQTDRQADIGTEQNKLEHEHDAGQRKVFKQFFFSAKKAEKSENQNDFMSKCHLQKFHNFSEPPTEMPDDVTTTTKP